MANGAVICAEKHTPSSFAGSPRLSSPVFASGIPPRLSETDPKTCIRLTSLNLRLTMHVHHISESDLVRPTSRILLLEKSLLQTMNTHVIDEIMGFTSPS